jgi:hypothetical protein
MMGIDPVPGDDKYFSEVPQDSSVIPIQQPQTGRTPQKDAKQPGGKAA